MNSIEALNELIDEIKYTHSDGKTLTAYDAKLIKVIKEDLNALNIILTKEIDIKRLKGCDDFEQYNAFIFIKFQLEGEVSYKLITNKEFKLLKGVIK